MDREVCVGRTLNKKVRHGFIGPSSASVTHTDNAIRPGYGNTTLNIGLRNEMARLSQANETKPQWLRQQLDRRQTVTVFTGFRRPADPTLFLPFVHHAK